MYANHLNDIRELIKFGKEQTNKQYKTVRMTEIRFNDLKKAVGLNTKEEIENKYLELYGEVIKFEII